MTATELRRITDIGVSTRAGTSRACVGRCNDSRMCGRATNQYEARLLAERMGLDIADSELWTPSYNIAPTQPIPVAGLRDGRRTLRVMRWGLIPSWSKDRDIAARCINARAETVAERPAFREAFKKRRCAVLVTGWYEWKVEG